MGGGGGGGAPPTRPDDVRAAITVFKTGLGVWPSNADMQWVGKGVNKDTGNPEYQSRLYSTTNTGNTPAAKGRYIISPFDVYRSTVSGLAVQDKKDNGNPSCVAFYAGRAWYSGVRSTISGNDSNSSRVFFSQVVESVEQAGKCYQSADPTSDKDSALVATDGGTIRILGSGDIYDLVPVLDSLMVVAQYGVWQIVSDVGSFTATSYSVNKITSDGCVSRQSIVNIGNALVYWSTSGIIGVSPNERGIFTAQSFTDQSIQYYYLSIPSQCKKDAIGFYDRGQNVVSWLYCENVNYANTSLKTHELNFRLAAGGFYKYKFASSDSSVGGYDTTTGLGFDMPSPEITSGVVTSDVALPIGYLETPFISYSGSTDESLTTTAADPITTAGGVDVIVSFVDNTKAVATNKKYIVNANNGTDWVFYFAELSEKQYRDGNDATGNKYAFPAYMETNYNTMSDPSRNKEIPYLTSFIYKHVPLQIGTVAQPIMIDGGGAVMSVAWDFSSTNTVFDTYQSSQFQTYKWDEPFLVSESDLSNPAADLYPSREMIIAKNRVNGVGKAATLRVEVPPMKGCHILGYSMEIRGNANV